MIFKRTRGRPKLNHPEKDKGTKELIEKRSLGLIGEPLDLCLKYDLITNEQHWSGIHYRWLYTVRFGVATIRSVDLIGVDNFRDGAGDIYWREKKEEEYKEVTDILSKSGFKEVVMDACILNKLPGFLLFAQEQRARNIKKQNIEFVERYSSELERFKSGLDILVRYWCPHALK